MKGKIYAIHNNINNKLYVGQTVQNIKARFNQHMNLKGSSNQLIYRAIDKYGRDNFYYEVLEDNINSYEKLNEREEYWIENLGTLTPGGYNLCPGGQKWRREPVFSEKDAINIIEDYKNGLSVRKIAENYGVNHKTVSGLLHNNEIELRNKTCKLPDKTSTLNEETMIELYIHKKMLIKDIAKYLNVSEKTVQRAKKRYQLVRI
ncbi:GIY-YIG nuclease family protein [Cytobacillus horneckiae]|uniref:GIY-YIG nuclease family protein n=1 Tax=Cytobacillus horneckiae TaxID=549687 RepID=UPI0034CFA357